MNKEIVTQFNQIAMKDALLRQPPEQIIRLYQQVRQSYNGTNDVFVSLESFQQEESLSTNRLVQMLHQGKTKVAYSFVRVDYDTIRFFDTIQDSGIDFDKLAEDLLMWNNAQINKQVGYVEVDVTDPANVLYYAVRQRLMHLSDEQYQSIVEDAFNVSFAPIESDTFRAELDKYNIKDKQLYQLFTNTPEYKINNQHMICFSENHVCVVPAKLKNSHFNASDIAHYIIENDMIEEIGVNFLNNEISLNNRNVANR